MHKANDLLTILLISKCVCLKHAAPYVLAAYRSSIFCQLLESYAFSALKLLVGRQEGHLACKKTSWLSVSSKVQTCIWSSWCHCHSLSLASVKSRLVLFFWYRLTRVVPDKGPLNGCVCVLEGYARQSLRQWMGWLVFQPFGWTPSLQSSTDPCF